MATTVGGGVASCGGGVTTTGGGVTTTVGGVTTTGGGVATCGGGVTIRVGAITTCGGVNGWLRLKSTSHFGCPSRPACRPQVADLRGHLVLPGVERDLVAAGVPGWHAA